MALLEDTLVGWGGGIVVGVGALFVLPAALPVVGSIVRPIVRTVVGATLAMFDSVSEVVAAGYDGASALVTEARADLARR